MVPAVLRSIYVDRKTGMLRFIRDDERRSIRFMSGHVVYGQASVTELHLGEVLIAEGRLDRPTLVRAGEVMQREKKRLGAVLVELGILDEIGLEQALALHVRAILTSVFSLREGTYTFQEQDPETFLEDDWPLAISTGEAILAAVRAVSAQDDVRFAVGDTDRVLLASDDPLVVYQRVDLGTAAALLLSRVDGTRTAREVISLTTLPADSAERALLALLCTGILEFAEGPRGADQASPHGLRDEILALYERLPRQTDHEVLGVTASAPEAEIKAAFFRLAKRYHPDVRHEPGLADLSEKLDAVFFRIHAAYRAIGMRRRAPAPAAAAPAAAPAPAGKPDAPPASGAPATGDLGFEAMLREGRDKLAEGQTWDAVAAFEAVVQGAQGRIRTRARVLLGKALLEYKDRDKAAEKELLAAVREDPAHVQGHYLLGTLYRRLGRPARAAAMFRRALELDPAHRAAQADLEAMGSDAPPPARGRRAARRA
jgi:tetratricopeptide (TPR) repeat protein